VPPRGDRPITASDAAVPIEDASFLRAVLEAIPAFVVRIDPDQRVSYINHLRAGVTLDQVIGRPVAEFIAPEDFEAYQRATEQALRTGGPCSYLAKGSRAVTQGGAASYEGHAVAIDNGDGRRAVCVIATDISEHLARAEALQESQEKLRVTVEATGIGLWTWDPSTDRIEWDQRLVEMVGSKPATSREYVERIVHPDDRRGMFDEANNASTGRPSFPEHRIVRPDGEIRWLVPCGRVTKDENGRVVRMTGGLLDVTAQRRTEEHLRNAQKLNAVGSLTAGVAHNFNNMLAVILPALELSMKGAVPDQGELLQDALHAAHRAADLVRQLMTFAGQRRAPSLEPIDLAPILQRAVSMCRRTFERQVRVESAIDPHSAKVLCDPTAIEQMVVNLLINSRDAVTEAGRREPRIAVHLSEVTAAHPDLPNGEQERWVRLRVQDNGVGMTDAVKRRLFEPFFTTKEPGKGTGLGLATSYAIARDHGGFIKLDSERGRGTIIDVFLPVSAAVSASVSREPAPTSSRVPPGRILVVDDEPMIQGLVRALLVDRGHVVLAAADGQRAIAALDGGFVPDVILLDRSLPGWPLNLTLSAIRKRVGQTPVLFFTGEDVTNDERREVQDVLYKPLSTDEFVRSVECWLERRG
jgi:two-component system cell cycle sensor histidine kinase/response regulator CckA